MQVENQWAVHHPAKWAVDSTTIPNTMRYHAKTVKSWLENVAQQPAHTEEGRHEGRDKTHGPHADIVGAEQGTLLVEL